MRFTIRNTLRKRLATIMNPRKTGLWKNFYIVVGDVAMQTARILQPRKSSIASSISQEYSIKGETSTFRRGLGSYHCS